MNYSHDELISREDRLSLNLVNRRKIVIDRGEGSKLWDIDGKEYIDCIGGWGVANIGHSNEKIIDAINIQTKKLITCPSNLYNKVRSELMEKLVCITPEPLTRVFLCNSGTESVEAAIKFTTLTTGKSEFIAAIKGFHGRTLGSLNLTHNKKYKDDFRELLLHNKVNFVPFNSIERIKSVITDDTAGIILEIIQGEGGVNVGSTDFFKEVREICDDNDIILIIDEVQTGFCRTGKMFAIEHHDIVPDILCLAKSIAGGLPMGAVIVNDRIDVSIGKHGTTFGGNLLVCAAAIATIDFLEKQNLAVITQEKGNYFINQLRIELKYISIVRKIKGMGLMIGIELNRPVKPYVDMMMNNGLLTIPTGLTVIRLLPPLVISYLEIDKIVKIIKLVLNNK